MKPLADCRLYAFVDTAYLHGRSACIVAEQLCQGGADLIQLRAKARSVAEVRRLALEVLPITNRAGVGLVINDHPSIAAEVGAMGCHLGQEDFFGSGSRWATQVTGSPPRFKLGISTHAPEQAIAAVAALPDYIAIGPVYSTPTKPTAPAVTLEYVRWAAEHILLPWFAIGGIKLENLDAVMAAGARRVAVVSAILESPDVVEACQRFKVRLTSAAPDKF